MFIDCKWVDTRWQWPFKMLHMHGLWRLIIWIYLGRATGEACSGNLEEKWDPSQHLRLGPRKTKKTWVEMAGRRTFRILASSQPSGI